MEIINNMITEIDVNEMTRKQFEELPIIENDITEFDSIVLLPTRKVHGSGYNYYSVVICSKQKALGRLHYYDTFRIEDWHNNGNYMFGIDCLKKSSLMRIFFPLDNYNLNKSFYTMQRVNQRRG